MAAEPSRGRGALVATAVALPVTVLLALLLNRGVLTKAAPGPSGTPTAAGSLGPVAVAAPPSSAAADKACPTVISHVPPTLSDQPLRDTTSTSTYVVAWGEPAITLRCGVARPAGYAPTSRLTQVDGVQWYAVPSGDRVAWTAVDRSVYIEVSVPSAYASTPIVDLAPVLGLLPAVPPDASRR